MLLTGCGKKAADSGSGSTASGGASSGAEKGLEGAYDPNKLVDVQVWPDRMPYTEVVSKFGAIPEIPAGFTMGAVLNEAANQYWKLIADGILEYCAEVGVTVEVQNSLKAGDIDGQLDMAEVMTSKNFDAYIFSPHSDDTMLPLTEKIQSNGGVVINGYCGFIDNANCFVGCIDKKIAAGAAQYIADKTDGKGKILLAEGNVGGMLNNIRMLYFKQAIAEYAPDCEVVGSLITDWLSSKALDMMVDYLTTNTDIDAVYCANDTIAMGIVEGLRAKNMLGQIMVCGMDGTAEALDSIKAGDLTVTFASNPKETGRICAEMGIRIALGQDIPRVVEVDFTIVDSSNIEEFMKAQS